METVDIFLTIIASKYIESSIDKSAILKDWSLWKTRYEELNKLKLSELRALAKYCTAKTKIDFIKNIMTNENPISLFTSKINNITFVKNSFGNFQNYQSRLIIDAETKKIIGSQSDNGVIELLKEQDIEWCKTNNLSWNELSVAPVIAFNTHIDIEEKINEEESDIEDSENEE